MCLYIYPCACRSADDVCSPSPSPDLRVPSKRSPVRPGVCVERAGSSVLKSPLGLRLGSSVLSGVGNASESLLTPWFSYNVGETMP